MLQIWKRQTFLVGCVNQSIASGQNGMLIRILDYDLQQATILSNLEDNRDLF